MPEENLDDVTTKERIKILEDILDSYNGVPIPLVDVHEKTGLGYETILRVAREKGFEMNKKEMYRVRRVKVLERKEGEDGQQTTISGDTEQTEN
jgi:hypothetical protein